MSSYNKIIERRTVNLTRIPYTEGRYLIEIRKLQDRLTHVLELITEINIDRELVQLYGNRGEEIRRRRIENGNKQQAASTTPTAGRQGNAGKIISYT